MSGGLPAVALLLGLAALALAGLAGWLLLARRRLAATVRELRLKLADRADVEQALRETEARLRALAEMTPVGILLFQGDRLAYINPAAEALTEYSLEEATSAPPWRMIHESFRDQVAASAARRLAGQEPPQGAYEVKIVTRSGQERWGKLSVSLTTLDGRPAIVGALSDITAEKRAREVQQALYQISEAAHAARDEATLFSELHAIVARLMPAENLYIAMYDREADLLSYPYWVDQVDPVPERPEPPGHGLTAYVLHSGRPLLATPDVFDSLVAAGEVETVGADSVDWLGVPLKARDETIGVLAVQSYTGTVRYSEADRDLLAYVSTQVAQAIARKQAERELRESQRALATLISNLPGMVYRCRADDGWAMEVVSEGCLGVTGYRASDLLHNAVVSYEAIIHPDDRAGVRERVERALAQRSPFELTYRIVTRAGQQRWVFERGQGVWDATGALEALEGFIADVSETREATEALRQSEERYRLLFDHAPMGVMHFDATGVVVDCNAHFCDLLGAGRERVVRFDWARHLREDRLRAAMLVTMSGGVGRFEGDYTSPLSGRTTPVSVILGPLLTSEGTFLGGVALVEDITPRLQTQQALKESEERYRLAQEAAQEIMYDWDIESGGILWNPNVTRVLGFQPEDLAGSLAAWVDLIHPEDRDRVEAALAAAVNGTGAYESEYRIRRRNGEYAFVADHGLVLRNARGKAVRMVGTMADQTAHRALEQQLRQAQRIEAVGQLAGGIAHDFNNLLTAMLGSTELLQRSLEASHAGQVELDTIHRACERAAELTHGLLAFARLQVMETTTLDLGELVGQTLPLLRRLIPENIEISFEERAAAGTVRGDRGLLTQVLVNLCLNARDAMPDGGRLILGTSVVTLDEGFVALHPGSAAGPHALLTVSDTGRGIPAQALPHVFEPFFTTKGLGQGSGMGLSVVYGMVKQHRGAIYVYSEPGHGTTVRVYLPAASGAPARQVSGTAPSPGGHETVLVVEDEAEVRSILVQILGGLGYRVLEAPDGQEALEMLRRDLGAVDLVLTDVVMPRLGGRELFAAVRELGRGPAFLFSSGYAESLVREGLGSDLDVAFIGKPYGIDELATKVREVLASHLASQGQ